MQTTEPAGPRSTWLTDDMIATLKSYVYVYIDPRNGEPFYVGKGSGDRFLHHLSDDSECEKVARIEELRRYGMEPRIDFLRYGVSDSDATLIEAAAIDLIGIPPLTNRIAGHHNSGFGSIASRELLDLLAATPVAVRHKAMLITINQRYRGDMAPLELYESTRGIWKVGERRDEVEYAMAVYQGVVREVYRIDRWHAAGTLAYETRDSSGFRDSGRWEFSGKVAGDIREEYVGYSVGKGGQNPIRYANV